MKLRLSQLMFYDRRHMVYRYGQKMHRGFLHRWRFSRRTAVGLFVSAVLIMMTGIAMGIEPHDISHALTSGARALTGKKLHVTANAKATARGANTADHNTHSGGSAHSPSTTASERVIAAAPTAAVQSDDCSGYPAGHAGLTSSTVPELRKLAEYEQLCGGAVAAKASIFVPTPATAAQAESSAAWVAGTLKSFAQVGVAPVVFIEPSDTTGNNLDLQGYAGGAYDSVLVTYFGALQSAGISSSMMGTWVFMPEANLPLWSTVDPGVYTQVVTRSVTIMKRHFPGAPASLMLDSESYAVGAGWGQGKYVSLLPYVQGIPRGLIDSFGLQGFPWAGPANQAPDTLYNPTVYLRTDLAVEAARALGVSAIWLNTGTFSRMYAGKAGQTVTLGTMDRKAMLSGVVQLATQVKAQGFAVSIHLFAQNKANLAEGTDWSYWHASPTEAGADTVVFNSFAHDATAAGLGIWLYDTTGN